MAAGLLPIGVLSQLVSIGSLLAFVLVCVGRAGAAPYRARHVARPFRVPGVPWVPVLGALVCLAQMVSLPLVDLGATGHLAGDRFRDLHWVWEEARR